MIRLQHIIALPDWEPVPDDPDEARKFLSMGVDTILANDYLRVSEATGLK